MAATSFNLPVASKCSWHCCSVSFEGDDRVHINKKYQVEKFVDREETRSLSISAARIHDYIKQIALKNKQNEDEFVARVEHFGVIKLADFASGKKILTYGDVVRINRAIKYALEK